MSKCMTIDETIDQKDIFSEVTPKDIVDSVLEEILVSVLTVSDKGCNRIGDFNINEDFCQQYNQPLHVKDFEQANINQTSSTASLYSDRNKERSGNGNENSGADWLGKTDEKVKPAGECKVISEEILADNELQIQNGQIHLERIKSSLESAREEYYQKENVIKDDKIEIEYYNQGKLNKIYVPLNEQSKESNLQPQIYPEREDENKKESERENSKSENESPFKPFTTEDLRQVWGNENSSLVGKWDGDMAGQPEEIVKLMEGLSNTRVYPEGSPDPNRPRTCSVAEEDIKKMIKEIEEISFVQSHDTVEDYPPEGQGDADLESKSFTKSKDILNKPRTESRTIQSNEAKMLPERSSDGIKKFQEEEVRSTEIRQDPDSESVPYTVKEPSNISMLQTLPPSQTSEMHDSFQKGRFGENVSSEERMLESNLQGETSATERLLITETFALDVQVKNALSTEDIKENTDFSATGSVDLLESQDRMIAKKVETINSSSISGNDIFSEFTISSELGVTLTLAMPCSGTTPKEEQNIHSSSTQVTEWPSDGKMKHILANENAENAEEDEKRPSSSRLTEIQSQGGSCSQSHKSSAESVTQSKGSGSLQSQESLISLGNQWQEVDLEKSESGKFKLHSIKMCLRMGCDPAGFQKKQSVRSESEEAFVETTESVLQIIEPGENGQDEESGTVSFSLLPQETNETSQKASLPCEVEPQPNEDKHNEDLSSDEISQKKVYSGMTTIGPMKNTDYDPKELTSPDIDFGKMTRITSSRQLAKDFNLLGADMTSTTTVKILEEDDSDESITESDNDYLETGSPVNRDIASLTKVQKIREVMSYQPKPEEDFEDEEALPKTRLDLKDVESSTDERYKVPEVGIPLLSFEVTSEAIGTEAEAEKQLIESMGLIISGLTEPYYENPEVNNERNENRAVLTESLKENIESVESKKEVESVNELEEENSEKDVDFSPKPIGETESKYRTLSGVIKKASKKFMKKESDVLLRNSKSLPRDTSKISTDRIRSILNEGSTSASNVLKKSRSMLRSTQSLFKSISQNRMIDEVEKHNTSPSETDLSIVERKLSFLMERKKEDFTKAKNLIKSKMDKTFKKQESSSEIAVEQAEISGEKKDLQVVIRNEEKLRVDRMENFKRWLPKSTLVYKSQFVKSQIKIKDKSPETDADSKKEHDNDMVAQSESTNAVTEETVAVQEIANEIETTLPQEQNKESTEEFIMEEDQNTTKEEVQPEFIVMETIQGLPTSDLESPSSEKENLESNVTSREYEKENDHQVNTIETQAVKEKELDIVPEHTDVEDKVESKIPPERKMIAKKKKLSTRLRNFWCSAFGRVKTPRKKSDVS